MSLCLDVDNHTWSQGTDWSELIAAAAFKLYMEDSESSSGGRLSSTGMPLLNAWNCSLLDDGFLMSSNNARSSGTSSVVATFTGCLDAALAAFCFIPGIWLTLKP